MYLLLLFIREALVTLALSSPSPSPSPITLDTSSPTLQSRPKHTPRPLPKPLLERDPFFHQKLATNPVLPGHTCLPSYHEAVGPLWTEEEVTAPDYYNRPGCDWVKGSGLRENGYPNPFCHIHTLTSSSPELVDYDLDGDLDLLVGSGTGGTFFYLNVGNATNPRYEMQFGDDNPYYGKAVASYASPSSGDFDGDGDVDGFFGSGDGKPIYLENDGSWANDILTNYTDGYREYNVIDRRSPQYSPLNKFDKGLIGLDPAVLKQTIQPYSTDIDSDGDADLLLANVYDGTVRLFVNGGKYSRSVSQFGRRLTYVMPLFFEKDITPHFPGFKGSKPGLVRVNNGDDDFISSDEFMSVSCGDVDGDGMDELLVFVDGQVRIYQESGDSRVGVVTGEGSDPDSTYGNGRDVYYTILDDASLDPRSVFTIGDVDGDGLSDILVGETEGKLRFFRGNGWSCVQCEAGFYAPPPPSRPQCDRCPEGTFTDGNSPATECSICPEGNACLSSALPPVPCQPGTVSFFPKSLRCYPCVDSAACPGRDQCAVGRRGNLCHSCEKNYYKSKFGNSDSCVLCGTNDMILETLANVGALIVFCLLIKKCCWEREGVVFIIAIIDFVQLAFLLTTRMPDNTPADPFTQVVTSAARGLFFHVDIFTFDCFTDGSMNVIYKLLITLVLWSLSLAAILFRRQWYVKELKEERDRFFSKRKELDLLSDNAAPPDNPATLRQKLKIRLYTLKVRNSTRHAVIFCTAIQIPLMHHLSDLFGCIDYDKGRALRIDTSINCDDNVLLLGTRYVLLLFTVAGLVGQIFFIGNKLYTLRQENMLLRCSNLDRFGIFCEVYKVNKGLSWWFGCAIMVRRIAAAAVVCFNDKLFETNAPFIFVGVNSIYGAILIFFRPYDWQSSKQYCLLLDISLTGILWLMAWVILSGEGESEALGGLYVVGLMAFAFWFLLRELVAKQLVNRQISVESSKKEVEGQFKRMTKIKPKKLEETYREKRKETVANIDVLISRWMKLAARSRAAGNLEYYLQSRYLNIEMIQIEIEILVKMHSEDKRGVNIARRYITYEHIYSEKLEETRDKFNAALHTLREDHDHKNFQTFLRGILTTIEDNKRHEIILRKLKDKSLKSNDFETTVDVACELKLSCLNGLPEVVADWEVFIHNTLAAFQTGDFDFFCNLENDLLAKIKKKKVRQISLHPSSSQAPLSLQS